MRSFRDKTGFPEKKKQQMSIWLECGVEGEKYLILYVQNGVGVDAKRIEKSGGRGGAF